MLGLVLASWLAAAPVPQGIVKEGFEDSTVGAAESLDTLVGRWTGSLRVDGEHAERGARCLHLPGSGAEAVSEVVLALADADAHAVHFAAERWTRRAPFRFTVAAQHAGAEDIDEADAWQALDDLSDRIAVGGFHTAVRLVLPRGTTGLRFRVTAPEETGVLLDEVSLHPRAPMELVEARVTQPIVPALLGRPRNPVLRLDLVTRGNQAPLRLESITFDWQGTSDLEALGLPQWWSDDGDRVAAGAPPDGPRDGPPDEPDARRFGDTVSFGDGAMTLHGDWPLREGKQTFWLTVDLSEHADLDTRVDARIRQVVVSGETLFDEVQDPPGVIRTGVAVRDAGDDDAAVYRIPGLVRTNDGTLLAVYDVRHRGWGDLPGDIDVGLSRSTDGGRTWEPMRVILDPGDEPEHAYDGVGDPSILVDRATGTIWVAATWHHGDLGWHGSGPGFAPEETGQWLLTRSDDDGRTWSEPINVTRQLKREEWAFLLPGPGRGIAMHDGTLVFPAQYQLSPEAGREPRATVAFSRDHGQTWQIGGEARSNTTEAAVVELQDGVLMLNMRDNRGRGGAGARAVAVSQDRGMTWRLHPTSGRALPEPVCMASLIHVGRTWDGEPDGRLLFSNPAVATPPRRAMTLRLSTDFGATWPAEQSLLLDAGRSAGYSCLAMTHEYMAGILYESSRAHLVFQAIDLSALASAGGPLTEGKE